MPLARAALAEVDRRPADLDAVVVGSGRARSPDCGSASPPPRRWATAGHAGARRAQPRRASPATLGHRPAVPGGHRRPPARGLPLRVRRVGSPGAGPGCTGAGRTVRTGAAAVVGAGAGLLVDLGLPVLAPDRGSCPPGWPGSPRRRLLTGAVPGPLTPLYLRRPDAVPPPAAERPCDDRAGRCSCWSRCGGGTSTPVAELESELFPTDSPWTAEAFWAELAAGHHYVAHRGPDGTGRRLRRPRRVRRRHRRCRPSACARQPRAAASAARCWTT